MESRGHPGQWPSLSVHCHRFTPGVVHLPPQYTMLCGHAPFYAQSLSTEEIMERIQAGQFSLEGPEWEGVSLLAKDVIERLLTVDARSRLTLAGLLSHPWLAPASAPTTPLQTSCVLGREKGTASAIKHTFHAFHQVSGLTPARGYQHVHLSLDTCHLCAPPPGYQGWLHSGRCVSGSSGQEEEEEERS